LYDGSNAVVSPQDRGVIKPTLPGWCYKDPRCVLVEIITIRNFLTHLSSVLPEIRQQHIDSACGVFSHYCGRSDPASAEHWDAIRVGLISSAAEFVIKLIDLVPISRDLAADQFFAVTLKSHNRSAG
jgi:hypothetical protein